MNRPFPRSDYKEHLLKLGSACAFCGMSKELLIEEHDLWLWVYAAFPYRKYHTLLIPKRHVCTFEELSVEEISEMKTVISSVEKKYRASGIVDASSENGDQLFFCWRSRQSHADKQPVAHFHIHAYPKFGGSDDEPLDPESHDIDMTRLLAKSL